MPDPLEPELEAAVVGAGPAAVGALVGLATGGVVGESVGAVVEPVTGTGLLLDAAGVVMGAQAAISSARMAKSTTKNTGFDFIGINTAPLFLDFDCAVGLQGHGAPPFSHNRS